MDEAQKDMERYLARIRKTIEDSRNLVSQAELRIAETDRLLEKQGLTREQVMAMRFSQSQIDAVNEELKRRGIDPLEKWGSDAIAEAGDESSSMHDGAADVSPGERFVDQEPATSDDLAYRRSKFGMMMKPFHI